MTGIVVAHCRLILIQVNCWNTAV